MRHCRMLHECGNLQLTASVSLRLLTSACTVPRASVSPVHHSLHLETLDTLAVSLHAAVPPQPPLGDYRHLQPPTRHGEQPFGVSEGVTNPKTQLTWLIRVSSARSQGSPPTQSEDAMEAINCPHHQLLTAGTVLTTISCNRTVGSVVGHQPATWIKASGTHYRSSGGLVHQSLEPG
jgi:hypothetical protein